MLKKKQALLFNTKKPFKSKYETYFSHVGFISTILKYHNAIMFNPLIIEKKQLKFHLS